MRPISIKGLIALCLTGTLLTGLTARPLASKPVSRTLQPAIHTSVASLTGLETIENGVIKVGVDSRYGGSITYLSTIGGANMVNNFDLGRQFQISLYGGPGDFSQKGHPFWASLGWNPVQAGDVFGHPAQVLAFELLAGHSYLAM